MKDKYFLLLGIIWCNKMYFILLNFMSILPM